MFFTCPSIQAHCNEAAIYLNFGTPKNNEFSIWNKWKIYYFWVSQYLSTLGYLIVFHMKSVLKTELGHFSWQLIYDLLSCS